MLNNVYKDYPTFIYLSLNRLTHLQNIISLIISVASYYATNFFILREYINIKSVTTTI